MDPKEIGSICRQIPIFRGFNSDQTDNMLRVCEERTFQAGEYLFKEGDSSTELFILLSGHLQVLTSTGAELASIREMGVVGEMGVLTTQPRSAAAMAAQPSQMLSIRQADLLRLMDEDKGMGFKIYRNVTHILCDRLRDSNILLEQQS